MLKHGAGDDFAVRSVILNIEMPVLKNIAAIAKAAPAIFRPSGS